MVALLICFVSVNAPLFAADSSRLPSTDWPSWRGPNHNSASDATGLIDEFDPKGGPDSGVVWKSNDAAGISTPIVMNGRLFTIVRQNPGTKTEAEKVVCLDSATGDVLWENVYNVFLSDLPAERVGWSNVCGDPETDRVYALGACCLFQCIDGETGQTVWSRSMSEEFGMLSTYGGRTNTPVVFENLVIISGVTTGWDDTAKPTHRFFAFDKLDGTLVWQTGTRPLPEDTTYSTPVVAMIDGQAVMVTGSGDGYVYGMQPLTGKILWREAISRRGINTSPVVDDEGQVFVSQGEENILGTAMGAVVCIDASHASMDSASAEKWRTEDLIVGKSSPLLVGDRLYVVEDSSRLHILDKTTGARIGEPIKLGTAMRGSLLFADGKIYAATSTGIVHIFKPTDAGLESIFKTRLPRGHDVGGSPIVADGKLFLPTTAGLFCLAAPKPDDNDSGESKTSVSASTIPKWVAPPGATMTQWQLVPAEAIVTPGEGLSLRVAGFDELGRRIESIPGKTKYTTEDVGAGTISSDGVFETDAAKHAAVTVVAQYGELTAKARLRVVPPLPWKFDFSEHQVPITWIGARYRHEARDVDGEPMIVKVTTIPKGTRSQTWFGPTDLHDYTVTADVQAKPGSNKLPDMGVIAQRYTLDLMGESQQLQIRTWAAQLRMARSVPVTWEAGVWYTLKLQASTNDGVAILKGKVWPRGEAEPDAWTVEATDEAPNLNGSPGLFGNATNAEIFIDNVSVASNG